MADFSEDDQVRLIHRGMDHLFRAGVASVAALRAGNAGASRATLRAALRSGIAIDSSYFAPHLNGLCQLPSKPELSRPVRIEGIIEVPITWFRDGFQCIRPAQICACSIGEFQHILQQAWSRGWHVVTLLLHSFELVRRQSPDRGQTVMRLHDYRFHELCRFLRVHSDKFASTTFRDVDWEGIVGDLAGACLRAPRRLTVRRHFEQAIGRIW